MNHKITAIMFSMLVFGTINNTTEIQHKEKLLNSLQNLVISKLQWADLQISLSGATPQYVKYLNEYKQQVIKMGYSCCVYIKDQGGNIYPESPSEMIDLQELQLNKQCNDQNYLKMEEDYLSSVCQGDYNSHTQFTDDRCQAHKSCNREYSNCEKLRNSMSELADEMRKIIAAHISKNK